MVQTDFPKVKIHQKKSPKFWRRPKKIDKISRKSFLDRSRWVLSESIEKNKNKIDLPLSKKLLLCCPNLEAVLPKYIATLQASKITLLWISDIISWGRHTVSEGDDEEPITRSWESHQLHKTNEASEAEDSGEEMDMQRVIGMSSMSRIFLRGWLRWRCRMQKNLLKILAQPKTHGNNMKTPFLSSFCLSNFRTVLRFPPKNLVPEILNLLTLVVCNCRLVYPSGWHALEGWATEHLVKSTHPMRSREFSCARGVVTGLSHLILKEIVPLLSASSFL